MKIVHLVDYFMPQMGYQEFYLAREHKRFGHKVWVVTSDRYYPFVDFDNTAGSILGKRIVGVGQRQERGISVIRLPILFEHQPSALVFIKNLGKTLKIISPDVVFCDGLFSLNAILVAWHQKNLGYRLVYDNHASDYNTKLTDNPIKKFYINFLFKPLFVPLIKGRATAIVSAVGEAEQDFVAEHFVIPKNKIPIIPLGVEIYPKEKIKKWRREMRKVFNFLEDDVAIVTAGKIDRRKRIEDLIYALKRLEGEEVRLFVFGSGERRYINQLKRLAKNLGVQKKIEFQGAYKEENEAKLLSGFDIGVWAGVHSQAVRKSLAAGLPLILPERVSKTQTSKFLLSYDNGLSFKKGNVQSLSSAIRKLAHSKPLRKEMGENSRRLAKDKLSWQKIAKGYLKIVGSL